MAASKLGIHVAPQPSILLSPWISNNLGLSKITRINSSAIVSESDGVSLEGILLRDNPMEHSNRTSNIAGVQYINNNVVLETVHPLHLSYNAESEECELSSSFLWMDRNS